MRRSLRWGLGAKFVLGAARLGDDELRDCLRGAQDLIQASAERSDVARDASVVIAGNYEDVETRKEPRPTEIWLKCWQLLGPEQDDRACVSRRHIVPDRSAEHARGLGEIASH
jgi:hypothetical protein